MSRMSALEYARKYWNLEVPIINDDNEIVSYENVKLKKYRLYQGWNPEKGGGPPPGQTDLLSVASGYAYNMFKQKKKLELRVKNVWGSEVFLTFRTMEEFRPLLPRAVQAFSGKGSPEDVQLTLQLAARCGVRAAVGGLQQYCDEVVDTPYPRLGLDCNGFVGNYLRYKDSGKIWSYVDPVSSKTIINGDMGIASIVSKLGTQPVKSELDMFVPRRYVLGMVNAAGAVIDGGFGPVGHIMILDAANGAARQAAPAGASKKYQGRNCLWYSGVEATPAVGLSQIAYAILDIADNGVATVWRDEVKSEIRVKMYPVI